MPQEIVAAVCQFPGVDSAVSTVTTILRLGVPVARIELLDALQMRACISYSRLDGFDDLASLFVEFHGTPASVAEQVGLVRDVCAGHDATRFRFAADERERRHLWKARHEAYWAARQLAPGKESFATDACVPISKLGACIAAAQRSAERSGLLCPILGHVGDGNFHALVLFDAADPAERARAETFVDSVARAAIDAGGTCTGEHGIGLHKATLLVAEHGAAVEVMRTLKLALDPLGIMNPGKMFER